MPVEEAELESVAVEVRITGKVQGVGYRAWCAETARAIGVSGWVRNAPDGSVEAAFGGTRDQVGSMLKAAQQGPAYATVLAVTVTGRDIQVGDRFDVLPTRRPSS